MSSKFDFDYLRNLISLMEETGLNEIEMKEGESTVRLSKGSNTVVAATQAIQAAAPVTANVETAPVAADDSSLFRAPMVGTFYASPSPDADVYVKIGDSVRKGETLCIIEAMKTFNQIEAEEDGVVTAIIADNAQPVEFGEPLFRIEKK